MRIGRARALLVGLAVAVALLSASAVATAAPTTAWWHLASSSVPGDLEPGGSGTIEASVTNLGDAPASGAPIVLTDHLPRSVTASSASIVVCQSALCDTVKPFPEGAKRPETHCEAAEHEIKCVLTGTLVPYQRFALYASVEIAASASPGEENITSVSGGGIAPASTERPLAFGGETPFAIADYESQAEGENGSLDEQAGSHPFQFTTTFSLAQILTSFPGPGELPSTPELLRTAHINLPPGLIGDANKEHVPQCTQLEFQTVLENNISNQCPEDTAIGVAIVTLDEPDVLHYATVAAPVYNLEPAEGEPARFGFLAGPVPVTLDTVVNGGDYHIVVNANNESKVAAIIESQVTIWGVPGDQRHDSSRGSQCLVEGADAVSGEACKLLDQPSPAPYLTLPTSCEPLVTSAQAVSWRYGAELLAPVTPTSTETLKGCESLPFKPSMTVKATEHEASTPTGLAVKLTLPQTTTLEREGLAEADIRNTTVTLPAGIQLSPSAANGLKSCSLSQIGWKGASPTGIEEFLPEQAHAGEPEAEAAAASGAEPAHECPRASKVGTVRIKTPILEKELSGGVYLAAENENPFGSLFGLYVVVDDPVTGTVVKLAGEVHADPSTGQITNTFPDAPELPFEEFELNIFGGPRATLATPTTCGPPPGGSVAFSSWSGALGGEALSPSSFEITSGPGASACPSPLPLAPGFSAGTPQKQAGAFTPFTLTLTREAGQQQVTNLSMTLPPGLAGYLSYVKQCPEPQASQGNCPAESLIGHATAVVGLGSDPYTETGGDVYITGPYGHAPFGLAVVLPAKAGPFDFGNVVTRSEILVNPTTAQLTINSALPTMVNTVAAEREPGKVVGPYATGAPVQLRQVTVTVERPGGAPFQFNPTNCSPMSITGTVTGDGGTTVPVSEPFQASGCEKLAFSPKLTAEVASNYSRSTGTSMKIVVAATPGQANIAKTKVVFPLQLPSRLTTLQKACLAATFEANPASCSPESIIGTAVARTPVLNVPLTGPAYLVSHGGAEFPDVEFVLQGEGILLLLDGKTNIHNGITSSTFNAVPDAPISTFEVNLPAGPHSAFTGYENLCAPINEVTKTVMVVKKVGKRKVRVKKKVVEKVATKLFMPTFLTGQNGDVIEETNVIATSGCKAVKSTKTSKKPSKKKKKKSKKKKSKKKK